MPAGGELDPRIAHPAGHREGAQPFAPVAALAGEPLRPFLDDVAHPVEGLDIVAQRRPAKEPDLRREGRPLPRQPALALDAFEHRRLFAADIGAGAAAQVNAGVRRQSCCVDRGDLAFEDRLALRVFVAQVDVNLGRLDHPGGDQHAFEHAVRVGFEKVTVLEGAGLALVGVDGQQPGRRLLTHQTPLAPSRKPGAAEPAQAGVFEDLDQFLRLALPGEAGREQAIAAGSAIGIEADKLRDYRVLLAHGNRSGDVVYSSVLVQRVPDRHDRSAMASAHAGRADDPDPIAEPAAQTFKEQGGPGQLAAQAIADPNSQRRRRRLVVHDDVEMSIERGDLVDLDEGELHLLGERREMPRMQTPEMVLQQMQVLDQQIAPALAFAEQSLDLAERGGIDLPSLRMIRPAPPPRARDGCAGRVLGAHAFEDRSKPLSALKGEREGPREAREDEVEHIVARRSPPPHPDPLPPSRRDGLLAMRVHQAV